MQFYKIGHITIFAITFISASPECLDNSYHVSPRIRYDYKNYHPAACTCRCDAYAHRLDRAQCVHCGHYRKPKELKLTTKRS